MNSLLLILTISILGSEFKEGDNQMINGFTLEQRDFNYHVFIFVHGSYECAGGIVDATHVITAAHCVENIEEDHLYITAGVKYLHDYKRALMLVKKKFMPEDFYNSTDGYYDIAVLRLRGSLMLDDNIGVITFPIAPTSAHVVTMCSVAGLERRDLVHGRRRAELSWLKLLLIPNEVCECMLESPMQSSSLCATPVEENQVTPGDSGAILVCDGVAVGILKGGRNYVYVFGRIYDFGDFIKNKIASL